MQTIEAAATMLVNGLNRSHTIPFKGLGLLESYLKAGIIKTRK